MNNQTMTSVADAIGALPSPYPPVRLITHYKGTTLDQRGQIVDINPSSATIQASQRLTFHVLSGMIHLRSQAFPGAISAHVQPVDYHAGTFHLADLSYSAWQDRKSERVQPKNPVYVTLDYHRKTYRVCLEDVSNEGMGILLEKEIDPAGRLQPGAKVRLELQLTPAHRITSLRGSIVYRKMVGQQLIKIGLQLTPNVTQKKTLQAYVFQRYDEIRLELEQEYFQICDLFRVENMFF